jgi:PKD repeat protein
MKKLFLALTLLVITWTGMAANWVAVTRETPSPAVVKVLSSSVTNPVVRFTLPGFNLGEVQTPQGPAYVVSVDKGTPLQVTGAPDLPKLTASLVIPDQAGMEVRVTSSQYRDFENILIAPSKGVITRDIDPASVPYQFGQVYAENRFFPDAQAGTRDPFILRDLRGQTIVVYPFSYNPVTKTLRVYYDLTVELYKVSETGINPLTTSTQGLRFSPEWVSVYTREFSNFDAITYTPLNDYGKMLVLCHNSFMAAMQPYVNWKNASGIPTEMVDVAVAGTTPAAIKSYIASYYNTNGLTFVLLVGDNAQVPTNQGGGLGGPSDNAYGYIVGNDHYSDVFVGRFSAETVDHVLTQVQRSLTYEQNPQLLTDDWFTTVIGIGSDQGPGDEGEYDYQHIRGLQAECLGYTYTWNPELFDGSQGGNDAPGNPTPATVATAVNEGSGLIVYCGHGSQTSWGTTGFSNSNVNQLTNQDKLPFIWSVACVNGDFLNGTCFAEAWLRASQSGQPTGAVAFLGATINQSWNSPMDGQDEMVAILTEAYSSNIKRTFAGLSINGCMKMIDSYGTDGQNMADTWTVFGDPSLMVRTDNPGTLTVTHASTLFTGSTSLTVNCDVEGARATVSVNNALLATGLISGGTVVLNFPALQNPQDTVKLVVTAYNYLPYLADITIITPNGPYVVYNGNVVNDATGDNDQQVDFNEDILLTVDVKNVGVAATSDLEVTVRSTDPYVQQTDSVENYGVIQSGQSKSVPDAYAFHVSGNIPDGHVIPFEMKAVDDTSEWTSGFSITAHAPALGMMSYTVLDPLGNNNGRLDPGETATLKIFLQNTGSANALNVYGDLLSLNPNVSVTITPLAFGDLATGQNHSRDYTVVVDPAAPEGQPAPFMMQMSADQGVASVATFSLTIGKIPVVIVDYDGNANSGSALKSAADALGVIAEYSVAIPPDPGQYKAAFVCLGTYPDNHALSNEDGLLLKNFLDAGGRLYMEGGDTWYYDQPTPVHPMFFIDGTDDGGGDLSQIQGFPGTFTEGMQFSFGGDNAYVDHITNLGNAWTIFKNLSPEYSTAVAFDSTLYRTIGSSFEFGGLTDAAYPSTKPHLLEEYLTFFGINIPSISANFAGYPTTLLPGGSVSFLDFSTGPVTSWMWSFPGGTPSTSSEKNPVVFYGSEGVYNAELIVSNGIVSDTLLKPGYITVEYPVSVGSHSFALSAAVAPNPSNGSFALRVAGAADGKVTIRIFNILGNLVYQSDETSVSDRFVKQLSLDLPNGIYLLNLRTGSSTVTNRIVINR